MPMEASGRKRASQFIAATANAKQLSHLNELDARREIFERTKNADPAAGAWLSDCLSHLQIDRRARLLPL